MNNVIEDFVTTISDLFSDYIEDEQLDTYWLEMINAQKSNKIRKVVLQDILTFAKSWGSAAKEPNVLPSPFLVIGAYRGDTALKIAVRRERLDIVKLLLDPKSDCVNSTFNSDHNGSESLLQMAVRLQYKEIVKLLLHKRATFPTTPKASFKMLLSAASQSSDILEILFKHGMQVPQDEARCGHFLKEFLNICNIRKIPDIQAKKSILCLYQNGLRMPQDLKFSYSLLVKLMGEEKYEILQILFDNGLSIPSDEEAEEVLHVQNLSYTLILQANNSYFLETLFKNYALKHDSIFNKDQINPIELFKRAIIITKHLDALSLIIKNAREGNNYFIPIVQNALATQNGEIMEIMFNSTMDFNYYKEYSILLVQQIVDVADTKLIKTLIQRGMNLSRFESVHYIIFQKAIEAEDEELLREMFKIKADINALDINGISHLHRAVKIKNTHIIKCLLDAGCRVELVDKIKNPLLADCVGQETSDIMELLVAHKQDCRGRFTILQFAIMKDKLDIVKLLLSSERSRDELDGSNCLELAITNSSPEMVQCLKQHGAIASLETTAAESQKQHHFSSISTPTSAPTKSNTKTFYGGCQKKKKKYVKK